MTIRYQVSTVGGGGPRSGRDTTRRTPEGCADPGPAYPREAPPGNRNGLPESVRARTFDTCISGRGDGLADRDELLAWADSARDRGRVRRWFLVHGEPDAQEALAEALEDRVAADVATPERGKKFELE